MFNLLFRRTDRNWRLEWLFIRVRWSVGSLVKLNHSSALSVRVSEKWFRCVIIRSLFRSRSVRKHNSSLNFIQIIMHSFPLSSTFWKLWKQSILCKHYLSSSEAVKDLKEKWISSRWKTWISNRSPRISRQIIGSASKAKQIIMRSMMKITCPRCM